MIIHYCTQQKISVNKSVNTLLIIYSLLSTPYIGLLRYVRAVMKIAKGAFLLNIPIRYICFYCNYVANAVSVYFITKKLLEIS